MSFFWIVFFIINVAAALTVTNPTIHLSSDQQDALKQFKFCTWKFDNPAYMTSDAYLVRWLLAYNYDVIIACEKFKDNYEWRQKHNMKGILAEEFPIAINEEFPFTVDSFDKFGRPVGFAPAGSYNLRKTTLKGQMDMMHRYLTMCFELTETYMYELQCSGQWKSDILPQYNVVVDMSGVSMWNFACFNCLYRAPELMEIYERTFPELVYRAYIINVPKLMEAILTPMKSLLSASSQDAIFFYGYDKDEWSEVLLSIISPEELPVKYGGLKNTTQSTSSNKTTWNWNNRWVEQIFLDAQTNVNRSGKICTEKMDIRNTFENNDVISKSVEVNQIPSEPEPTVEHNDHSLDKNTLIYSRNKSPVVQPLNTDSIIPSFDSLVQGNEIDQIDNDLYFLDNDEGSGMLDRDTINTGVQVTENEKKPNLVDDNDLDFSFEGENVRKRAPICIDVKSGSRKHYFGSHLVKIFIVYAGLFL